MPVQEVRGIDLCFARGECKLIRFVRQDDYRRGVNDASEKESDGE